MGKTFWEMQDIAFHARVPEFQVVKGTHLLNRLVGRPPVKGDTVGGDEHAAAVSAKPAMDEDFSSWALANKSEELGNLFVSRGRPAIAGQIHETHAQRLRALALILNNSVQFAAEVDNGVDAKQFEVIEPVVTRLGSAVQIIVDLAKIRNSGGGYFLGEYDLAGGWCGCAASAATLDCCG